MPGTGCDKERGVVRRKFKRIVIRGANVEKAVKTKKNLKVWQVCSFPRTDCSLYGTALHPRQQSGIIW